jgi:hypothetical protein
VSLLEKAGCKHAKVVIQPDFVLSAEDVKDPSAEAISLGGKFYYEVWLNGGREIADEVIRRNEEEVNFETFTFCICELLSAFILLLLFSQAHQAKEEAKKVEEAAELE